MNKSMKPEVRDEKDAEPDRASTLVDEVTVLPKRFFIFPQEGISMHWLDDDSSKPQRGMRPHKKR